ncbi:MAG: transaldolase, partial [Desulfobacterales bacterium]|nr:transaldolase [Desulfobacterales bacterium]
GYVSLEVDPTLADDTEKTISEARRLYETVHRPNVMIKVPATPAGVPAITELIGAGVNVNVTLIFGLENYRQVVDAYLAGLEKLAENGPSAPGGHSVRRVSSVASVFISRVDTTVDQALEKVGNTSLQGKIAIAGAKLIYAEFNKSFSQPRWEDLAARGARVQRVLWASTSSKNPAYPDTIYVDSLIGPETVNTIPPATLNAFLDHGAVEETLLTDLHNVKGYLKELAALGVDLDAVTRRLQEDGVAAFVKPFDELMANIAEKKEKL